MYSNAYKVQPVHTVAAGTGVIAVLDTDHISRLA